MGVTSEVTSPCESTTDNNSSKICKKINECWKFKTHIIIIVNILLIIIVTNALVAVIVTNIITINILVNIYSKYFRYDNFFLSNLPTDNILIISIRY